MPTSVTSTIEDIQKQGDAARSSEVDKKNGNKLDKNAFLRLLTAQMQYQDPTSPMDNTAFVAQLAQFSSLESMNNVNETLTKLLTTQNTSLQNTAIGMVGKTAVFATDQVSHTEGKSTTISADLSNVAMNVTMQISDEAGLPIRTIGLGPALAGKNTFSWDGKNDDGDDVLSGIYTIELTAQDMNDTPVTLNQFAHERITGVSFVNGEAKLTAGGVSIDLSQISEITE
jgi:flagellar basal-body rod modification protein FlgD